MAQTEYDVHSWNEIYQQLFEIVGLELSLKLFDELRGLQINFPTRLISSKNIGAIVLDHYNGTNLKQLAHKLDYSERHLRRLIQLEKEKNSYENARKSIKLRAL